MKLYRIRYKKSFVTRGPIEEVYWNPETEVATVPKMYMMPGTLVEICEMVAEQWAKRPIMVPEQEKPLTYIKPGFWETVAKEVPGYWKDEQVYVEGHIETKEYFFQDYTVTRYKEIPGYYELRKREIPAWIEYVEVLVPENVARKIPAHTEIQEILHPAIYEHYKFYVDATSVSFEEVIPAGYKDTRIWIPGQWQLQKVWVPATIKVEQIWHEPVEVITSTKIPAHQILEDYLQPAHTECKIQRAGPQFIGWEKISASHWFAIEAWFREFQYSTAGQMYIQGTQKFVESGAVKLEEMVARAYEIFRQPKPDITLELVPDVFVKLRPYEAIKMLDANQLADIIRKEGKAGPTYQLLKKMAYEGREQPTPLEFKELLKIGTIAALIAAGLALVFWTWPGARYDLKITYTDWVYVLRYMESFQMADLVSISPQGTPYYWGVPQWGGPIMGEDRSPQKDIWHFGEEWKWSSWHETAKWMGVQEERYWYEAEVEYLGMVTKTGANFYRLSQNITDQATGGHEPGWIKPAKDWGEWEEEMWHERIEL